MSALEATTITVVDIDASSLSDLLRRILEQNPSYMDVRYKEHICTSDAEIIAGKYDDDSHFYKLIFDEFTEKITPLVDKYKADYIRLLYKPEQYGS